MLLGKDTVQIQFAERRIGGQVLHFCQAVMGEVDLLEEREQHTEQKKSLKYVSLKKYSG